MNLEADYFNKKIPITNYILDSGRGLGLLWLINKVPSQALPLWKAIEEYLYNQLKEFGADRQALDATRILRVPGSINSKSKTVVSIIDECDYIYDLREIQKEYLPELKPKEKKKGRPKKINYIYRERSLYYARIQDITKLCELREYDLRGHREIILFLYRYYLCSFTEDIQKALEDVLELNSMFTYPLKESEVIRATRSAEKCYLDKNKEYKYKNDTLIELLEITEDEEVYMTTIISKNEYKRRDRVYQKNKYHRKLKSEGKISEERENLENLSKELGILEQVEFKGALNRDEVYKVMSNCNIFVLPSRFETFGVVLIEALANGKPVISTRNGGANDIVTDENGILVDIDDIEGLGKAMVDLKLNYNKYNEEEIRNSCINKYSKKIITRQLEKVYSELICKK